MKTKWMKTALVLAAAVCLSVAAAFTALAAQTFQITASIGSCLIGSGQNTVDTSVGTTNEMMSEAVQALVALGYGNTEALKAVRQVEITEGMDVEEVLRQSLKYML